MKFDEYSDAGEQRAEEEFTLQHHLRLTPRSLTRNLFECIVILIVGLVMAAAIGAAIGYSAHTCH